MKAFIDTNIILEYVLQRERAFEAKRVVLVLSEREDDMLMSVGGFYTLVFLIEKYLRQDLHYKKSRRIPTLRNIMQHILQTFQIAEHDNQSLLTGIEDPAFTDLEDSCQYQVAKKVGCDVFITFNISDFPVGEDTVVRVLTPQQYLDLNITD